MNHQKHPKLKRPSVNTYHRNEWAIYGTTCANINEFYNSLQSFLKNRFRLLYVDADHGKTDNSQVYQVAEKQFRLASGFSQNDYLDRLNLIPSDGVIVNGNHYPASRQIIFLDDEKKDSLLRRVDQLSNVYAIVKQNHDQSIYDYLSEKISKDTIIVDKENISELYSNLEKELQAGIPKLKALVLAGGQSSRMGEDKSQIKYDGRQTEELRLANLCQELSLECFISKASDYPKEEIEGFQVIKDRLIAMGPFGAILSAMISDPDAAWLVVACDLPFVNKTSLLDLVNNRNHSLYATAYKADEEAFPEPLIAIYEPKSYRRFLEFLGLGYACPRKVLINSEINGLIPSDPNVIRNINSPEDRENASADFSF